MQSIRPLPGITFRAEPPAVVSLPRMDVAGFVGFAKKGPVNIPVPVEDYPRFENIFGGNYRLAWDDELSDWQTACLAPAVKDFFAQGGRRCWIVRVADEPVVNQFHIAGLLQTTITGEYSGVLAEARSGGSWSDDMRLGASILQDVIQIVAESFVPGTPMSLSAVHLRGKRLIAGELLQLDFSDDFHRVYVPLHTDDMTVSDDVVQLKVDVSRMHWFRRVKSLSDAIITILTGEVRTVAPSASASTTATFHVNTMSLGIDDSLDIMAGDWVTLTTASDTLYLLVGDVRSDSLLIRSAWYAGFDSSVSELTIARATRVRMALQVHENIDQYRTLSDLAFSHPHPRFVGYLPNDATFYDPHIGQPQVVRDNPAQNLWREVQQPRFPVHVPIDAESVVIPLGLESASIWREALPLDDEPLVRDGIVPDTSDLAVIEGRVWSEFWQKLYLDPRLRYSGQRSLIAEANDIVYIQNQDLIGLHALFPIEEVSMVALPDIGHRGWFLTQREQVIISDPPIPEPEDPCSHADRIFQPHDHDEPELDEQPDPPTNNEVVRYWKMSHPLEYVVDGLLDIQIQLAKLGAGRGDFVAMLSLPRHYRTPDVLEHQRTLYTMLRQAGETTTSYTALYHPWTIRREDSGNLLYVAPDGNTCGVMAKRSLERGAWVAPSNVALRGVLALFPQLSNDDEISLYNAGINLIQSQARGFVVWGANTQSLNPEFTALNVRRLMILLRRIALIEGQSYVFAPHSPAFRRRVKQIFERQLAVLFERGAFVGRDPSQAYQVVIDETLNTQSSIEQGRLIVELRVAPSRPIVFITVRLIQTDTGLLTVQEVVLNG